MTSISKKAMEIAESLFDEIVHLDDDSEGNVHDFVDAKEFTEEIAKALEDYAREAYLKGLQAHPCCCDSKEDCDHEDQGFEKGAASMRERCAKAASDCWDSHRADISCHAYAIRDAINKLPLSPGETEL